MTTFDPAFLEGVPAPIWLVLALKVLGLTLHWIPMGLWLVGLPVALACCLYPCVRAQRFGSRLLQQLPIAVALGINFGIVPLLFLQTLMPKAFYTATILMAWQWISVIPLLIVGYYAVYLTAFAIRDGKKSRAVMTGVVASLSLVLIGIVMTCGMTLMATPALWDSLWEKTQIAGAVTGLAHSTVFLPAVWVRLLAAVSLGLLTTAVWGIVDSHILSPRTDELLSYRVWTRQLALLLTTLSLIGLTAMEIVIKSLMPEMKAAYPLVGYVVALVVLLWLYLLVQLGARDLTRGSIVLILFGYLTTIAHFVVYRQMGQLSMLRPHSGLLITSESVEWSPIIVFLILFVLGAACIAWMVRQMAIAGIDGKNHAPSKRAA